MSLPAFHLPTAYAPPERLLDGRVILVTGAGQGLGRVAAMAAARHGATVILHGRNVGRLEAVYDAIESEGLPQPAVMPLDFSKATQAELDGFAHAIQDMFKRLDGIFHGASHFVSTMPMDLHDLDMWQKYLAVNLAVPASLTKACLPLLKRAADASIVFLTETHAQAPRAFWGPFAVSKSALESLTAILADEFESTPVRVNLCLPSPVASPMRAQSHPGEVAGTLPDPEELAADFLYLLGPDSAAFSGGLFECHHSRPVK